MTISKVLHTSLAASLDARHSPPAPGPWHHGPGPDMAALTPSQDAIGQGQSAQSQGRDATAATADFLADTLAERTRAKHAPLPLPPRPDPLIILGWLTPVPKGVTVQRPSPQSRAITPKADAVPLRLPNGRKVPGKPREAARWQSWFERTQERHEESVNARTIRRNTTWPTRSYTAQRCVTSIA